MTQLSEADWANELRSSEREAFPYLTRARAHDIGLLPAAGTKDWWLIDGHRLIVMRFDPEGRRITNELITAPAAIEQAVTWRDRWRSATALMTSAGEGPA